MDEKNTCPNCSAEFGVRFKCDQCSLVFCDQCEAKKKIDSTETHFLVKFFCPKCNGSSTRVPVPAF